MVRPPSRWESIRTRLAGAAIAAASLTGAYEAGAQDLDAHRAQQSEQGARERQQELREHAQTLNRYLGGMDSALRNVGARLQESGEEETAATFARIASGVRAAEEEATHGSTPATLMEAERGYEAVFSITRDRAQSAASLEAINHELGPVNLDSELGQGDPNNERRQANLSPREARALTRALLAAEPEEYQPNVSEAIRAESRTRPLSLREGRLTERQISLLALYVEAQPRDESHPDRATGMFIRNTGAIPYSDMVRLFREISSTGGLNKGVWDAVYARLTSGGRNPTLTPNSFDRMTAGLETRLPLVMIDEAGRMAERERTANRIVQQEAGLRDADSRLRTGPETMPNLRQALRDYDLPAGPERDAADERSPRRNLLRALREYDRPRAETPDAAPTPVPDEEPASRHHRHGRHHRRH